MPRRVLHDRFFKQAKADGYLARSAYKLLELNDKRRLLTRGAAVLDLGCAPGSWLQVAAEIVGPKGYVVGIDLQAVDHPFPPFVRVLQADAFTIDPRDLLPQGRSFDVVLSDMAPSTTGHGDDFLSARLCRRVLDVARLVLRPGGSLCMKILEGSDFPEVLRETKAAFDKAGASKPAASRDVSRETFIIAQGKRPGSNA